MNPVISDGPEDIVVRSKFDSDSGGNRFYAERLPVASRISRLFLESGVCGLDVQGNPDGSWLLTFCFANGTAIYSMREYRPRTWDHIFPLRLISWEPQAAAEYGWEGA